MTTFAEILTDLKTRAAANGKALEAARALVDARMASAEELVVELARANVPQWEVAELTKLSRATVGRIESHHGIVRQRRNATEVGP